MIVLLRKGNQWEKIEIMNKRQEPRSCHFKKEEKLFEELIMLKKKSKFTLFTF